MVKYIITINVIFEFIEAWYNNQRIHSTLAILPLIRSTATILQV